MKKLMKVMLSVLVVGTMIFAGGCSSSNNSTYKVVGKDDGTAVSKYGENLTLNNGEFVLSDYMDEKGIESIKTERFERCMKLKASDFDTDTEKTMILQYLLEGSDKLPGDKDDSDEPDQDKVKETVDSYKEDSKDKDNESDEDIDNSETEARPKPAISSLPVDEDNGTDEDTLYGDAPDVIDDDQSYDDLPDDPRTGEELRVNIKWHSDWASSYKDDFNTVTKVYFDISNNSSKYQYKNIKVAFDEYINGSSLGNTRTFTVKCLGPKGYITNHQIVQYSNIHINSYDVRNTRIVSWE